MDRRDFLKVGAVSFVSSSIPISIYHFLNSQGKLETDPKDVLREAVKTIIENTVTLHTHSQYDGGERDVSGQGLIFGDYIITCDHIVSMHGIQEPSTFGTLEIKVDVQMEETRLNGVVLE